MDKFFTQAASGKTSDAASMPQPQGAANAEEQKKLPKGMVIGKDGKPCRSCTSAADWIKLAKSSGKQQKSSSSTASAAAGIAAAGAATAASTTSTANDSAEPIYPSDCPPDVERLGNSTWTLLHSISAQYPERASSQQQSDIKQFLTLFGKLYPCWVCAEDFQEWMAKKGNEPRTGGRDEFGTWMCEAHNEVNRKLGKKEFDCTKWQERWRDGWKDGRCG